MTAHTAHPSPATLAAFVDGRLSGRDLHQMVEHLASCQECFEVVAETAEIQEELDEEAPYNVIRYPSARKRWAPRAALLAAALAVAVVGLWQWNLWREQALSVDRLAGKLGDDASRLSDQDWSDHGWPVFRNATLTSIEEEKASFRAGVLALDLQLALEAGETERAKRLAQSLISMVEAVDTAAPVAQKYRALVLDALERGDPAPKIARAAAGSDRDLVDLTSQRYRLAKWAEAGRLAARVGDGNALSARVFRASVDDFLDENPDSEIAGRLQEIQERLKGRLADEDLDWLAGAFRSIVAGEGVRIQEASTSPPSDSPSP